MRRRSSRHRLLEPAEAAAQLLQAEAHAALDRADRRIQHLGDLRVREAAEVRQLDHLALLGGKLVQGGPHRGRLLAPGGLDIGSLARFEAFLEALVAGSAAALHDRSPYSVLPT